ncbi:MAG TPA: L-threonylcarbamoyladenylate synthase [Acidimicrobiia bacterium]|nr:L-threonylcarbamoyladenylate synthase [Acidimicrobiia bacterium]
MSLADVGRAVDVLRGGGLVAFPTETVYGLGADASSAAAVRRLFAVKRRPAEHPVIVHLGDPALLSEWAAEVPDAAAVLARACWPGPLTVVVRRAARVPDAVTGGRDTVGLRVPDQPLALELLRAFGGGVAAPSANRFGRVSPTTAADVRADLGGDVDLVLDGGPCRVGIESTIVDCTGPGPAILREGGVPRRRVEALLGTTVPLRTSGEVAAPGTLASHYAPRARVELTDRAEIDQRATAALARGERVGVIGVPPADARVVGLGEPADGERYAHDLYAMLRAADACELDLVLAIVPTGSGLAAAVADRLRRAAGGAA